MHQTSTQAAYRISNIPMGAGIVGKLVFLKIGEGSFEQGFPVTLQIGEEQHYTEGHGFTYRLVAEVAGKLPPAVELPQYYRHWQSTYRRLGTRTRLEAPKAQITNVSVLEDCQSAAKALGDRFNTWLRSESFRPIREKWLEQLLPGEPIRVILQTDHPLLQRLPWQAWELGDRYTQSELALSLPTYEKIAKPRSPRGKIKILAILGNSQGIDVQADRDLLEQLPDAEIHFLVEPQRQELTDQLWAQPWDLLFFAGHSSSQSTIAPLSPTELLEALSPNRDQAAPPPAPSAAETGSIAINTTDSLTIGQLRYALRKAVERGLQFAIFNSCDGLGLARNLADLQIPQMIVMREPVPDRVAQEFLKAFLSGFSQGEAFYLAVRQARERLQGLEDQFPCATWLPIICQNPAEVPPTWRDLTGWQAPPEIAPPVRLPVSRSRRSAWLPLVLSSLAVTVAMVGIRHLGWLQASELTAFDQLMRSRPAEGMDQRFAIIGITANDIESQKQSGRGSLSDATFSQLLSKLAQYQPRVIGLDLYRNFPVSPDQPQLAQQIRQNSQLIMVCKSSDRANTIEGIGPPPEIPPQEVLGRIGYSDFWEDPDGILRRQVLLITPEESSPCAAPYAFSTQLAMHYLTAQGIQPTFNDRNLQLGTVVFPRLQPHTGGYRGLDAQGNQLLVNYRATEAIAPQISLSQLLAGQVDPDMIKDRIVLIGVIDPNAGDIWSTPYGTGAAQRMPGVHVQAHMTSQLISAVLDQRPILWTWGEAGDGLWIGLWSTMGGFLVWSLGGGSRSVQQWVPRLGLAIGLAVGLLYGICLGGLIRGAWLPLVPSVLGLFTTSSIMVISLTAHSFKQIEP